MQDILDDYNDIEQLIALAWCDLIEYEFVALGKLQGDDGIDIFLTELHRMEYGVFSRDA